VFAVIGYTQSGLGNIKVSGKVLIFLMAWVFPDQVSLRPVVQMFQSSYKHGNLLL